MMISIFPKYHKTMDQGQKHHREADYKIRGKFLSLSADC